MEDDFVYSTGEGDLRKKKKREQTFSTRPAGIKNDGIIRVQREKKGRGGKTVSLVYGMPVPRAELKEWAAKLKQQCGSGGSVKDGVIVLQGDRVDKILEILKAAGFQAKQAGGKTASEIAIPDSDLSAR
jgi:translation initiation factor 1